jgi:Protein of unknown function (DUF1236)
MIAKLASATALALVLGASAAAAQSGGDARNNDRKIEKALDDQALTPVRPIRRVGPNDWPSATNSTTGQSTEDAAKQDAAKQTPAAQNQPANQQRQDAAKQEAAKPATPQQDAAKQNPPNQEAAKQNTSNQNTPNQDAAKQEAAKPDATKQAGETRASPNNAATANRPAPDNKETARGSANQQDERGNEHGLASIRLGTDAQGRVAINDEQERQIATALRKQRVQPIESSAISVKVGAVAPAGVRLGAVSADLVAVLPQFRGYSFFATRDEIVIVEPGTRKIAALVPVKLTATAAAPQQDRDTERAATRSTRRSNSERDVTVGAGVPSEEEILRAPTTRYRSSRTFEPDDTVIIERRRRPAWLFGFGRF